MSDDPTMAELGRRMTAMERTMGELRSHVDDRFDRLGGTIAGLAFVPVGTYSAEQASVRREIERLDRAISVEQGAMVAATSARTISWWALGLLVSIVLVAVMGIAARAGS